MSIIVKCKKNIKYTYIVLLIMLALCFIACIVGAADFLLFTDSPTIDEILGALLMIVVAGLFAWGIYSLSYSLFLTIIVNGDEITITRMSKPTMTLTVGDIENVTFGIQRDSSRYGPKSRYVMRLFAKGEGIKLIEDEMENFDMLCSYLLAKDVPAFSKETKINLSIHAAGKH